MAERVFNEAWEAQAFAIANLLQNRGYVSAKEWTEALSHEIAAAGEHGEADDGTDYYLHWLAALERLVAQKGFVDASELSQRKDEWEEAARATPHGKPIELRR